MFYMYPRSWPTYTFERVLEFYINSTFYCFDKKRIGRITCLNKIIWNTTLSALLKTYYWTNIFFIPYLQKYDNLWQEKSELRKYLDSGKLANCHLIETNDLRDVNLPSYDQFYCWASLYKVGT